MDFTTIDLTDGLDRDEALALLDAFEDYGLDVLEATLNGEPLVSDDVDNTPDPDEDGVDTQYPFDAQPFAKVEIARTGIIATGNERAVAAARAFPAAFLYPGMDLPSGGAVDQDVPPPNGWFGDNPAAAYLSTQISQAMSQRSFLIAAFLGGAPKLIAPFKDYNLAGEMTRTGMAKEVNEVYHQIGLIRYRHGLLYAGRSVDQNRFHPDLAFTPEQAEDLAVQELTNRVKRYGVEPVGEGLVDWSPSDRG